MDQEFLDGLGLDAAAVEAVLHAHDRVLQSLRLEQLVAVAIGKAGGKNHKAVAALLDMQSLADAEDPQAAVDDAVAAVKLENSYLFDAPSPPPYAKQTGAADPAAANEPVSLAAALRARMRR